jgi:hypothetical protein
MFTGVGGDGSPVPGAINGWSRDLEAQGTFSQSGFSVKPAGTSTQSQGQ